MLRGIMDHIWDGVLKYKWRDFKFIAPLANSLNDPLFRFSIKFVHVRMLADAGILVILNMESTGSICTFMLDLVVKCLM